MTIGERVRAAREAKGWTQWELTKAANVQVMTISGIELGRHQPTVQTLCRLAKGLGVEVGELLDDAATP